MDFPQRNQRNDNNRTALLTRRPSLRLFRPGAAREPNRTEGRPGPGRAAPRRVSGRDAASSMAAINGRDELTKTPRAGTGRAASFGGRSLAAGYRRGACEAKSGAPWPWLRAHGRHSGRSPRRRAADPSVPWVPLPHGPGRSAPLRPKARGEVRLTGTTTMKKALPGRPALPCPARSARPESACQHAASANQQEAPGQARPEGPKRRSGNAAPIGLWAASSIFIPRNGSCSTLDQSIRHDMQSVPSRRPARDLSSWSGVRG